MNMYSKRQIVISLVAEFSLIHLSFHFQNRDCETGMMAFVRTLKYSANDTHEHEHDETQQNSL